MSYDPRSGSRFSSQVPAGTRLNGIFEIDAPIGAGGMGEIYKGHNIQTGDALAIKVIRSEMAENEAALALFRKEASILHNLSHDAIVRYYVFSIDPDLRRPYLAMEFVDGLPLSEILHKGPLKFEAVRALRQRLAAGLQAAHSLGVVHRDVSPDNVILPGGDVNRAKIIDFGIARSAQLGGATVIGGGFAGKYNYVSPEQLGLYGGEVTGKSDIYSLALVLAEALTGRPIDMQGSQAEVVEKRRRVPDLSGIDPRIRPLLESMLQPRPQDRSDSMAAIAAWQESSKTARHGTAARPREAGCGRGWRPWLMGVGALGIVAVAGTALSYQLGFWPGGPPVEDVEPPPILVTPPAGDGQPPTTVTGTEPGQSAPPLDNGPTPTGLDAGPPGDAGTPPLTTPPTTTTEPPVITEPPVTTTPPPTDVDLPTNGGNVGAPPTEVPTTTGPAGTVPGVDAPSDTPPPQTGPTTPPPGETTPADTPPEITPPAEDIVTAELTRFIKQYDGGSCFFATPLSVSDASASIEAFGAAIEPFKALDTAFRNKSGFEAQIGLRQVTAAQCPVVDFLRAAEARSDAAPRLSLGAYNLKNGDSLTGSVTHLGNRHIAVLLVSDEGLVYNLEGFLTADAGATSFGLQVKSASGAASESQLVLALATPEPLIGLPSRTNPIPAEALFPIILDEIRARGQTLGVSVKYFKLEG